MAMDRIYGDIDAATESATGLFYRKKETVGTFRIRFDDVSPRGSNPTYTAYGYASIDAPSGGYYGAWGSSTPSARTRRARTA